MAERKSVATAATHPPAGPARWTTGGNRLASLHKLDKAFPVSLEGAMGHSNGVGRNITPDGMFVESRVPCPLGSEVRITFAAPDGTQLVAVADVRFQCFLNYAGSGGREQDGLRGFGVKFVRFEGA